MAAGPKEAVQSLSDTVACMLTLLFVFGNCVWQRPVSSDAPMWLFLKHSVMQAPQDDKVALKEIHDTVRQHYELINSAFTFYPTGTSADVFHMGLNNFTGMLEDCKV